MENAFADDVLCGADEIAGFLYGDPRQRRRVFYLVEKSRLPVFRMGATICMRRSTWFEWVKAQEARATRSVSQTSEGVRATRSHSPNGEKDLPRGETPS